MLRSTLALLISLCTLASADEPAVWTGRNGASLYQNPEDCSQPGAWPVGVRTVRMAGLECELLYPAVRGSQAELEPARFDLRAYLPEDQQTRIADADNPWQVSSAFRDLPLDTEHGPYPLVLFIHGTSGFRTQSLAFMEHWASRGFVVVAADHPGIMLRDAMQMEFGNRQSSEACALLDALRSPSGDVAFLEDRIDMGLVGIAGHSAGGMALHGLGEEAGVRVLIPMAARGSAGNVEATLVLGAVDDLVVPYSLQEKGFEATPGRAWLVGIRNSGHLLFTDLVNIGRERGGLLQIAMDAGVEMHPAYRAMIGLLATDGMRAGQLTVEAWPAIKHASSAVLEEVLHGAPSAEEQLSRLTELYPEQVLEVLSHDVDPEE